MSFKPVKSPPIGNYSANGQMQNSPNSFSAQHPTYAPIKTRPKLYGDHILKGYVSMINGAGGTGKSVFSLTMACGLAIGRDLLGLGNVKARRVLLLNNEDPSDEIERRLMAIAEHYRFDESERRLLQENLWFKSGYHNRLLLASEDLESKSVTPTALQNELIGFCTENNIDAIFIDPLVSIHDSEENNNNAMNSVIQILRVIAENGGVGIYVAHHSKKSATAETPDDNARGASAITAGVRANYGLSRMTEKESGKFVLADGQWAHLIRLDSGKRNYSANAANADWFELRNVALNATDWETGEPANELVGVPEKADLQAAETGGTGWSLERVMEHILVAGVASPFALSGEPLERLQEALSSTNKPLTSSDSMHRRMKYFPPIGEPQRLVKATGNIYKCWTEKGKPNRTIYHYEEMP